MNQDIENETCKKCGYNEFELIDGHFYCNECNEIYEKVALKLTDEFGNENIKFGWYL